jgi:hypothetical protein
MADRGSGKKPAQQKEDAKVPDGFDTQYVVHPGKAKGTVVFIQSGDNAVLYNKAVNPFTGFYYTDGFHGYIFRKGRVLGPFKPGQALPTLKAGDKILKRLPPEHQKAQSQQKAQPKAENPYKDMPYGDRLMAALKRVPGMLGEDLKELKTLLERLTTDPEFAASLAIVVGAFAALQGSPVGLAIDAVFMVVFGVKAGVELFQFFYQAYQAKDTGEAGIKAAAESFKNAVVDGGGALLSGLAGGFKTLSGLLKNLQGEKNLGQMSAVLSKLKPAELAQVTQDIASGNVGRAQAFIKSAAQVSDEVADRIVRSFGGGKRERLAIEGVSNGAIDPKQPMRSQGSGTASQGPTPQPRATSVPQGQAPAALSPGSTRALTPAQAKALGGRNRGIIFVQENLGTPRNAAGKTARDFESGTTGAYSDTASQRRAVPALRYDNPNPRGDNFVKFDGIEGNTLIDSKTRILTFESRGRRVVPQVDDIIRVSEAARQNPQFKVVYEFPSLEAQREARQILLDLGITNIRTRVRR